MDAFRKRIREVESEYKLERGKKEKRLESNCKEQEELRRRLEMLEREESQLRHELSVGDSQEDAAQQAKKKAEEDVKDWRMEIVELQNKAETSLKVMKEMSGESSAVILLRKILVFYEY